MDSINIVPISALSLDKIKTLYNQVFGESAETKDKKTLLKELRAVNCTKASVKPAGVWAVVINGKYQ